MQRLTTILFITIILAACGKKSGAGPVPNMSFADVAVLEGNGGVKQVELVLTLSHGYAGEISVTWSTADGTAKSGEDYTAVTNEKITFQPNETSKKIMVEVVADDIKEGEENFEVRVQNPVNVNLTKGTAIVTLQNDDTKVAFTTTGYEAPASYPGYTLTWSDEFNGSTLDAATWTYEIGDGCPGLCGWGNNELEYYTSNNGNLFFQDGKMIIEAKAENFGGRNYTSARIISRDKQTFKYGRIDIRAILPKGKGIWPAFWMLPQDNVYGGWPTSGEIDIMEYIGSQQSRVLGTLHYGPGPGSTFISRNYTLSSGTFNDEFHVFSIEWKEDEIKWYVDNNLFSTITKADIGSITWPFNEEFFFIINMAVGGNLPGNPDAGTVFPQWLIVDYVRVFQ